MDAMTILYGEDGTGGLSSDLRVQTGKVVNNYFGEMSNQEILDILSQIAEADDFPDFVIDWYDLIENYLDRR